MPTVCVAQDTQSPSAERPATVLKYSKWSGDLNVPDPVAISFDRRGRAYVTQTRRRKAQDLDIRQHRAWLVDDLGLQSADDKREFYRRVLAPDSEQPLRNKKHVADLDGNGEHDYRDLMVLSEIIHRVEDTDGDGIADKINVFADGFQSEITGIAAGVLAHQGDVYATIAPDVWKLRDTNHSGQANQRQLLATGFGAHLAYAGHDMHGLTVGPDGKIYWSIGDKGINVPKNANSNRTFRYPNQGGVMRCNPDGSEFEVFAHGLRNVQELAFDQYGNLFGFDNDSDQPNERERFVHIVYGMDAGWRCNYQYRGEDYNPWMAERIWEPSNDATPGFVVPPIANSVNGPCGFAFNPGTALSPDYKDYFFLTSTMSGQQLSFKIQPKHDSFEIINEHRIGEGVAMIGINFGPDGALYGVDWAGGYPLNQTGAIWKIDAPEEANSESRKLTEELIRIGGSIRKLGQGPVPMLYSRDQRLRLIAQDDLVKRRSWKIFLQVALDETGDSVHPDTEEHPRPSDAIQLGRIHAIWGMGQLLSRSSAEAQARLVESGTFIFDVNRGLPSDEVLKIKWVTPLAKDFDPMVRLQIARTVGDLRPTLASGILCLLDDDNPHVRAQAAISVGRTGLVEAFDELVAMASKLQPGETYLRHAVTMGMAGITSSQIRYEQPRGLAARQGWARLESLADHSSPMVRLCAVVAIRKTMVELDYQSSVPVNMKRFLADRNVSVATEAARAIHDDFSIETALDDLAGTLRRRPELPSAFVRRAINANYRIGDEASQIRLLQFAQSNIASPEMRRDAIRAIGEWQRSAILDRVTGRHRGQPAERRANGSLVREAMSQVIGSASAELQVAAIKALRKLNLEIPVGDLEKIYRSELASEIRIEALESLVLQSSLPMAEKSRFLGDAILSSNSAMRMNAMRLAAKLDSSLALGFSESCLQSSTRHWSEKQLAIQVLGQLGTPQARKLLSSQIDDLMDGKLQPELMLEVLVAGGGAQQHAANNGDASELKAIEQRLIRFEINRNSNSVNGSVEAYSECRSGGDPQAGKKIFNTHLDAQCVRCHRVGKKGSTVGPDLAGVATREPAITDPDYLLRSIVDPSAQIVKEFKTIMLVLDTGETVQGVLIREDDEYVVLGDSEGNEVKIEADAIDDEKIQKISMMPQAKTLSKREIRDLVAYLKTLQKEPGNGRSTKKRNPAKPKKEMGS